MRPEDEKTLTIALRTKKNLDYIYEQKQQGANVEEFTQLLNSMLGMVICVREDYFSGSRMEWSEIENLNLSSWDPILKINGKKATTISPNLQQVNSFSQLITKLRHAFAHNCFTLQVENKSQRISGVTVWNVPQGKKNIERNRVWEADISENDLKGLANLFVEYLKRQLG